MHLLMAGELRPVAVPSVEEEALRDLVHAREDLRGDLLRARHRLAKLLLLARCRDAITRAFGRTWCTAESPADPRARVIVAPPSPAAALGALIERARDGLLDRRRGELVSLVANRL